MPHRFAYGSHPSQFGELTLPRGTDVARGLVLVVHGGFWRQAYGLDLGRALAADLARSGLAVWNIEYRRVGIDGGGWPATFDDVSDALDALAGPVQRTAAGRLPLDQVVLVGHSAGGHLATWLAGRSKLPTDSSAPGVRVRGVVSQAGVLDLIDAAERHVGGRAVEDLLGGPLNSIPERYAQASPIARVPIGLPTICVHGTADTIVPIRQSERYVHAPVGAGDEAEIVALDGVDHFAVIDPSEPAWRVCRGAVDRLLT